MGVGIVGCFVVVLFYCDIVVGGVFYYCYVVGVQFVFFLLVGVGGYVYVGLEVQCGVDDVDGKVQVVGGVYCYLVVGEECLVICFGQL